MMQDEDKTKEQLIVELHELRGRLVQLDSKKADQTSAEQALQESEERYRAFFEGGPDGVVILNPETGQPVEFNNQVCQQLGYSRDEFARLRLADIEVLETDGEIQSHLQRVVQEGHDEFETLQRTKQGEIRHVHVTATMIHVGRRSYYHCVWRDITDRKQAEEVLRKSKEQLCLFIEHAPASLAMFDREMRYLSASRRWLSDYRVGDRELTGLSHYEVFPEIPEHWKEAHRRGLSGEVVRADSDRFERYDGSVHWECWEVRPWYDANGEVGGIVIFTENITERKQAEEALRESERKYRQLAEGTEAILWEFDLKSDKWLYVAPRAEHILGYSPNEWTDMASWADRIHEDDRERAINYCAERTKRGEDHVFVYRFLKKDGSIAWIRDTVSVEMSGGSPVKLRGFMIDVTERKLAEEAVRKSEEQYRTLVENSPIGIYRTTAGAEGNYLAANPALLKMFGFDSFEELRELTPAQRYANPLERKLFSDRLLDQERISVEHRLKKKDGTPLWGSITARVVRGDNGEALYFDCTMEDITARKLAEKDLQESEAKYRGIVEDQTELVSRFLPDGTLTFVNRAYCKYFGENPSNLLGHTFWHHLPSEEQDNFRQYLSMFSDHRPVSRIEHSVIDQNGNIRWQQWTDRAFFDGEGNIVEFQAVGRDITELKQAEEALRLSAAWHRTLVETIPDLVWLKDMKGIYLSCNPAFERFFGAKESEIVGKTDYDFKDKVLADFFREHDRKALEAGGPSVNEEWLTFADNGYQGLFETIKTPMRDVEGNLVGVLGISRDISERKRAEEALRESEENLRTILDATPFPIALVDEEDNFIHFWNRSASNLFGHTAHTVEKWYEIAYPDPDYRRDVIDRWRPMVEKARLSTHAVSAGEYRVTCSDGSVRICELYPAFRGGKLIVSFNDITERKRAEEERQRLEAQLHHSHKMEAVGTLAGGIAHEFNNVLGIIMGNAELAKDDIPEWSPAKFNLDEIKAASLRAKDVVRQLLTFSRKGVENRQPINLVPLVTEATKFLKSSIPTSIEIRQNVAERCHTIMADSTQIHQVMLNLATNAAHAMEETGGILEFSLQNVTLDESSHGFDTKLHPGEHVMLEVRDTGCGIPAEILNRIFDPYFTTKEVGKGTGMGLSVVHGIIEAQGGSIRVESTLGQGTTFKILFPATKDKSILAMEIEEELPTGSERILFIDDEPSIAKFGRLVLQRLGYKVQAGTNPRKALELFASNPEQFDLIITDTTMPGMTGDKLIQKVLQIRPDMKTILCTGYSERVDEENARSIGAKAYATKPLDRKQLAMTVREVLEGKEL